MRALVSFMKKEWLYQLRSSKLVSIGIIFVMLGMLSPAIAKLTPDLLDLLTETQGSSSMTITVGEVTALDSWMQFFKNIPMALIVFLFIQSNIFTKEYESGTLILSLTKGLKRSQVLITKVIVLMVLWTIGYWLCFGITYGYNMYYWDNTIACDLFYAIICWWVFGLWCISLLVLCSSFASSNTTVLTGILTMILLCYAISFIPQISEYIPTYLMDGNSIIYGIQQVEGYHKALLVSIGFMVINYMVSLKLFHQKQL